MSWKTEKESGEIPILLPYREMKTFVQGITGGTKLKHRDIIDKMTLEEKAALMQNTSPAIPRLGIKAYDWWNEALHGVGRAGLATVFPQAIGMGASFNNELLYDVFTAVSDEARAKNTEFSKEGGLKRYQGLHVDTQHQHLP